MKAQLESILEQAQADLGAVSSIRELSDVRVKYLGKKGELTTIRKGLRDVSPEDRPAMGQLINDTVSQLEAALTARSEALEQAMLEQKLASETIDVTMPGKPLTVGKKHPLNVVLDEFKEIFLGLGFSIAEGPEVELDHYNFEALNIPKDHPARDTQDTFYISDNVVLRTQTSPMQVRTMEKKKPPIRIIAPGRVYRSDAVDATHSPLFHQIEGLVVDKDIRMSDLKGILELPRSFMATTPLSASALTTSPLQSLLPRWISSAISATAQAAACVRARDGLKFLAVVWCIRTCWRSAALTRTNIPAMPLASVWNVWSWVALRLMISVCSMRTTFVSCISVYYPYWEEQKNETASFVAERLYQH